MRTWQSPFSITLSLRARKEDVGFRMPGAVRVHCCISRGGLVRRHSLGCFRGDWRGWLRLGGFRRGGLGGLLQPGCLAARGELCNGQSPDRVEEQFRGSASDVTERSSHCRGRSSALGGRPILKHWVPSTAYFPQRMKRRNRKTAL